MPIIDAMLKELEHESETTRRVLERVPDDKLTWKPHQKSFTLAQLATHVATIPGVIGKAVTVDNWNMPESRPYTDATSRQELLDMFSKFLAEGKEALRQLDDAKLMSTWTLSRGGQAVFSLPRIAVVRSVIMNHLYHHRGQLSVYLRLLDVPVPSMYGPSADENPFA